MIDIGSPHEEMHPGCLSAPGGFAWWYVDLVTPGGDGVVLIWSYGLPFLPGYAGAARGGRAPLPVQRPSVNVAVYRGNREVFYLLQEHAAADASLHTASNGESNGESRVEVRIGASTFASWTERGRRRVEARLDCALPGTRDRLRGTVRLDGVARRSNAAVDAAAAPHLWTPLVGPSTAEAELQVGERMVARLAGRGYHDRNGGTVPLHALGIDHWMWGRLPFRDRERIYYLLWPCGAGAAPLGLGVEIDADGAERVLDGLRIEVLTRRRNLLGVVWAERLRLWDGTRRWLDVTHTRPLDSGPFYIRYGATAVAADGERASALGEICYPDRVDRAVHRPFVRMRVHDAAGRNSPWLPIFTGPRRGRAGRLVRHLFGGGRTG